jgi:hypothetical protein
VSNSAADGVRWTASLDGVVAETAAGRLLPGMHRCLLRVETPAGPNGAGQHLAKPGAEAQAAPASQRP